MPTRFCIVTPSYNTRRYLGACIDSVIAQACPLLDYLIMDGGSTDGSVDLLRSYGGQLRWISARDKGQSDAINRGFAQTAPKDGDELQRAAANGFTVRCSRLRKDQNLVCK